MNDRPSVLAPFFLLLIAGLCGPAYAESQTEEITRLQHEWDSTADPLAYEKLLADDFMGQWADGTVSNKKDTIQDLRSGHDTYEEKKPLGLRVRIFGEAAVVTGTFYEKSKLGDKSGTGTYRFTDVWVKRGGTWQMVAFQSLRLTTH